MPWQLSLLGSAAGVVGWLYALGSALVYADSMATGCSHSELITNCDEQKWTKVLVLMVAKTAIVAKVVRYPVYTIDPNRRTVAVDGYWGTIKPVVTRIGFPTLIAAAGMASVPFQYLLRLQVGVALIAILTFGLIISVALASTVEACRGTITVAAGVGRLYSAGVGVALLGTIIAAVSAQAKDYWSDSEQVAVVVNSDLAGALVLEAASQIVPWIISVCCWRRGAVIQNPDPESDDDDYGVGDKFIFDDVRDMALTHPHLSVLADGLDGVVPRNVELQRIAIPGDHHSTSSESSDGE